MPTLDLSLPNLDHALLDPPTGACLASAGTSRHAPRFLLLYGSLRERSYSKLLTLEAARLLIAMGGEVRVFDPTGLPLPDSEPDTHPNHAPAKQTNKHQGQLAGWSKSHGEDQTTATPTLHRPTPAARTHAAPQRVCEAARPANASGGRTRPG